MTRPGEALLVAPADRREGALLQHLQQLDLHRYRDLADLVEEQRAVLAAALEHAGVVVDGAGERALAVAEQLRLDQVLRELRQVDGEEGLGEAGGEAPLRREVRDERRAPDRRRRLPLAGAGLAQQQRGEILHPVPQRRLEAAHVVREDVVPQRLAQAAHRFAAPGERAVDEIEAAPQLVVEREVARRPLLVEAALHQAADDVLAEGHRQRRALVRLLLDQRVEVRHRPVVADVEQRRRRPLPVFRAQPLQAARAHQGLELRPHHPRQGLAVADQVARRRPGREPHDQLVAPRA